MKKHSINIQQLFEDATASITKAATDSRRKKAESANKSGLLQINPSLSSTAIKSNPSTVRSSSAYSKRSKGRLSNADRPALTSDFVVQKYGNKLTAFELDEIKNYSRIYCLGLSAKKIGSSKDVSIHNNFDYDDIEHFYRVVPSDHIAYRYEIVADRPILGQGTFGQVIKAYDMKERQFVALKIVRNDKDYLRQSREEIRILHVLKKHDIDGSYNIVSVKEFFMFRNHMVMSFELLGMNLYQVLKLNQYRGLSLQKVKTIARAILRSLELLFKLRIVHCDVKPENILLRKNGDFTAVKLADFGSSCYEQNQIYRYIQSRYYRAPEVIMGFRYGPAIDMWSLGCVLGELAKGLPIFMGEDEFDQLAAIEEVMGPIPAALANKSKVRPPLRRDRGPPGSRTLKSIVPGEEIFRDVIRKMLELHPEVRSTPLEMMEHQWFYTKASIDRDTIVSRASSSSGRRTTKPYTL